MIAVRYLGGGEFGDLVEGREYEVIAISLPHPKIPFFRIIDESEEDYLYPWDRFEIVEGNEVFEAFLMNEDPREELVQDIQINA